MVEQYCEESVIFQVFAYLGDQSKLELQETFEKRSEAEEYAERMARDTPFPQEVAALIPLKTFY